MKTTTKTRLEKAISLMNTAYRELDEIRHSAQIKRDYPMVGSISHFQTQMNEILSDETGLAELLQMEGSK